MIESVNDGQGQTQAADVDTDALLAEVYKPESPTPTDNKPAAPVQEATKTWKLKRNDVEIEKPENEVINLAQMGLDYQINNRLLRTERDVFEADKAKYKPFEGVNAERLNTLKAIDDYAEKNPKFLELIQTEWQKLQSGVKSSDAPATSDILSNPLYDKVSKLELALNSLTEEKKQNQMKADDAKLESGIKELKSKYSELQWDKADENGATTEYRLIKHMSEHGFPSPKAAFMDLYGEQLLELRTLKAREEASKEIQDRNKRGIIVKNGLAGTPSFQPKRDVTNASYDDLAANIIRDLGVG